MTLSCNSVVIRSSRCELAFSAASSCRALNGRIWFRARTSSPTRFMSLSSRPTATRMVKSATVGALVPAISSTGAGVCGVSAAGAASPSQATRKRSRSSVDSSSPSSPVASSDRNTCLIASIVSSSSDTSGGVRSRSPFRNWLKMFSATCVIASSFEYPRKPQVPLIKINQRMSRLPRLPVRLRRQERMNLEPVFPALERRHQRFANGDRAGVVVPLDDHGRQSESERSFSAFQFRFHAAEACCQARR